MESRRYRALIIRTQWMKYHILTISLESDLDSSYIDCNCSSSDESKARSNLSKHHLWHWPMITLAGGQYAQLSDQAERLHSAYLNITSALHKASTSWEAGGDDAVDKMSPSLRGQAGAAQVFFFLSFCFHAEHKVNIKDWKTNSHKEGLQKLVLTLQTASTIIPLN